MRYTNAYEISTSAEKLLLKLPLNTMIDPNRLIFMPYIQQVLQQPLMLSICYEVLV